MSTPVNLLLVDDEPRNLEALEAILHSPQYRLVRAGNAKEALLCLLAEEYAAIVLDIQMPDIGGIELANLIKQRAKTSHVPIIFLTALYENEARMLEGYEVGAVDYLTKPVNAHVLRSKIAVFVELFRKNIALAEEVKQREAAERQVRAANEELEARVRARTAALQEAHAEAQRAGRAKDDFIAALSHELRTPLNPVLLIASESADDESLAPEVREHFATIRKNVELEARLIDDLLDLTRLAHGKLELRRESVRVDSLINNAIITCGADLTAKSIVLSRELHNHDAQIYVDSARITQVLWNLLKNSIKFTPNEGKITIRSRLMGTISAEEDGLRVLIEIEDTGRGIDAVKLEKVFDAFEQGSRKITQQFGGLGLGLAISRAIAEAHGGTLTASSPGIDLGATFRLILPVEVGTAREIKPVEIKSTSGSPSDRATQKMRILLVEDHKDTAKVIARLISGWGHEVVIANTLNEALDVAAREIHAPGLHLVISDLGLPDGSGLDLMRGLSSQYGLPGIAVSGYGMESDRLASLAAGFTHHMTKPINSGTLRSVLSDFSRGRVSVD